MAIIITQNIDIQLYFLHLQQEACKGSSTTIDVTPNRLTSADTLGYLDLYGGGSDSSPTSHVVALQVLPLKMYQLH